MKPEKKPFVVEIKNRRRVPRKEQSIWGKIDLKAAGSQVAEQAGDDSGKFLHVQQLEAPAESNPTNINA